MRRTVPLAILAVFALMACKNEAGGAPSGAKDDAKFYDMKIEPVSLAKGETGALQIVVTTKEGFKWNDEYPAKLTVAKADTDLVHFPKTTVKKGDPEIAAKKHEATLKLPVQAKAAGDGTLEAKVSFSLCTPKTCHVFRNRDVKAAVHVK